MKMSLSVIKLNVYLLVVFVSLFFVGHTLAHPDGVVELLTSAPGSNDSALVSNDSASGQLFEERAEPYIKRSGQVYLNALATFRSEFASALNTRSNETSLKGTYFSISFFPENEILVVVDSDLRPSDNVISLGGHQVDNDISTFSMTITQEKYLITYQDLDNALTYRVVGDVATGTGTIVEIDLKKMPPSYDLPPVIPQND